MVRVKGWSKGLVLKRACGVYVAKVSAMYDSDSVSQSDHRPTSVASGVSRL